MPGISSRKIPLKRLASRVPILFRWAHNSRLRSSSSSTTYRRAFSFQESLYLEIAPLAPYKPHADCRCGKGYHCMLQFSFISNQRFLRTTVKSMIDETLFRLSFISILPSFKRVHWSLQSTKSSSGFPGPELQVGSFEFWRGILTIIALQLTELLAVSG